MRGHDVLDFKLTHFNFAVANLLDVLRVLQSCFATVILILCPRTNHKKYMKEKPITFEANFSWEQPVEDQLLDFVRHMATNMEITAEYHKETGWFANNSLSDNAHYMALAYRTVEKKILEINKFKT